MSTSKPILSATDRLAYSISEFCDACGISRSHFYSLSADQRPREVRIGGRRLIPADAAREFLNREVAA